MTSKRNHIEYLSHMKIEGFSDSYLDFMQRSSTKVITIHLRMSKHLSLRFGAQFNNVYDKDKYIRRTSSTRTFAALVPCISNSDFQLVLSNPNDDSEKHEILLRNMDGSIESPLTPTIDTLSFLGVECPPNYKDIDLNEVISLIEAGFNQHMRHWLDSAESGSTWGICNLSLYECLIRDQNMMIIQSRMVNKEKIVLYKDDTEPWALVDLEHDMFPREKGLRIKEFMDTFAMFK